MKQVVGYSSSTLPHEKCEGVRMSQEMVIAIWPEMEKQLNLIPHIWATHWTMDAMRIAVTAGQWQVWGFGPPGVIRVTVFTYLTHFPAGTILQIPIAFGNSIEELLPVMEATFERFAQSNDCSCAEIYGRAGWEKKLPEFRRVAVVLRRKVTRFGVH